MKLNEWVEELNHNPEFVAAEKTLRFRFSLANAILRARIHKGWSQADLAAAVGTRQANISRVEAGLANPTLDFVRRICDILNIDVFFSEENIPLYMIPKSDQNSSSYELLFDSLRIDDQPENIFCHSYRT